MDSKHNQPASYTYAEAGVSIETGNALVRAIAPLARATRRPGADADLGGFGGFFDLKAAGFNDPLLVAANDGVGTKLKLAFELKCPPHILASNWSSPSMRSKKQDGKWGSFRDTGPAANA